MYHSIIFENSEHIQRDTWRDWRLIPTSRPVVSPPRKKEKIIDIPGRNGYLDLSTALTGYPVYENRTGSWEFSFQPPVTNIDLRSNINYGWNWVSIYTDMMEFLDGGVTMAYFDDDPLWYYRGYIYVDEWKAKSDGDGSRITIKYDLEPYKLFYKNTSVGNTQFDLLEPNNGPVFERIFSFSFPEAYNYTGSAGDKWHIASAYRFKSAVADDKKKQSPWNYYGGLNSKEQNVRFYWNNRASNTAIRIAYYHNHKLSNVNKLFVIEPGSASGNIIYPECIIGPYTELYIQLYSNDTPNYSAECDFIFKFLPGRL